MTYKKSVIKLIELRSAYQNSLSITSQFSFCGLPFRMDTYSGCAFNCTYCFARLRGGNVPSKKIRWAESNSIITRFKNALQSNEQGQGIITEFIQKAVPVHFGGMSDPFQHIERTKRVSFDVLNYLCSINYPVIVSTKSTLLSEEPYFSLLRSNSNVLVQFSLSTTDDRLARITEPFSTRPTNLLRVIEKLSGSNIKTSIRWQPFIPMVSEAPNNFVNVFANIGVKHVAFEHLKLPVEKNNPLIQRLLSNLNFDLRKFYTDKKCITDGREYILPANEKKDTILNVKSEVSKLQMTFGAADNEFQYLSDTNCCCSGADQFPEFKNWNKFQIAHAVKKSAGGNIHFSLIENEWYPKGAIDKHLNSKSRIPKNEGHNTVLNYIRERWENLASPFNPTRFFGVTYQGKVDDNNMKVFEWADGYF